MKPPLCVVLIPFNERGNERFGAIAEAAQRLGLRAMRVAQYYSSGMILEEVVRSLCDANMVIADLTDANHNVCYELGIAHAIGKRVFHLAQAPGELPAGLRRHNPHPLALGPSGVDRLTDTLKAFLHTPGTYSPIGFYTGELAVLGERLLLRRILAFAIDLLLFAALLASATALFRKLDPWSLGLLGVVPYFALVGLALRSTLGQRLVGIEVIRLNRRSAGALQALLRPVAAIINVFTFGIGFLWMLRGPRYQAVHDRLTRTLVVRRRRAPELPTSEPEASARPAGSVPNG